MECFNRTENPDNSTETETNAAATGSIMLIVESSDQVRNFYNVFSITEYFIF